MRYFMLTHEGNNPFPRIVNWSKVLDSRKLSRQKYQELPSFIALDMEFSADGILPDIIVDPFLLLSKEAMEVVNLYDSTIPFRIIVLFDLERKTSCIYYCPILLEKTCCSGEEIPLFQVKIRDKKKTVIRLDLAESLLERGATGLDLKLWE